MIRKFITMLSCLFFALTMFTPLSRANAWNKKTIFTFSEPVEIPGVALPAGTYVSKLHRLTRRYAFVSASGSHT